MELIAIAAVAVGLCCWWRGRRGKRSLDATKRADRSTVSSRLQSADRTTAAAATRWSKWLDRKDVLIVDTETTGFGQRAEVIEVAVLDTRGTLRYEALILPEEDIPRAAVAVHGLTRAKLEASGARPWPDMHSELSSVLKGATVAIAWNASFDRRMLEQTAERHGMNLPRIQWHDLLADYRQLSGEAQGRGRHTLASAVERTGAALDEPAHRAAGDCRRVLAVMRAVLSESGP